VASFTTLSLALIEYAVVPCVKVTVSLPPDVAEPVIFMVESWVIGSSGAETPLLLR